ncbi:MAG: hypothetical protein ABH950_10295 [Candidatus Altiarchaeota archaeon]
MNEIEAFLDSIEFENDFVENLVGIYSQADSGNENLSDSFSDASRLYMKSAEDLARDWDVVLKLLVGENKLKLVSQLKGFLSLLKDLVGQFEEACDGKGLRSIKDDEIFSLLQTEFSLAKKFSGFHSRISAFLDELTVGKIESAIERQRRFEKDLKGINEALEERNRFLC